MQWEKVFRRVGLTHDRVELCEAFVTYKWLQCETRPLARKGTVARHDRRRSAIKLRYKSVPEALSALL